ETNVPIKWSVTKDKAGNEVMENIAWRTPIDGIGHSSPIVHGDRVFVTTCLIKEQKRVLICIDRPTGKIVWQRDVVESPLEKRHGLNSHASSTPATDGKLIFVTFLRLREKKDNDAPPANPN